MKPYLLEIKYEFLSLARAPRYVLPTLALPIMFYVLFGIVMSEGMSARMLLCGYSIFGLLCSTMFGIAPGVSTERALGWLSVKRASPMPSWSYMIAKSAAGAVFGLITHINLSLLGIYAGHVQLTWTQWLSFTGLLFVAMPVFTAMGFLLGTLTSPGSSAGIVNMVTMPMSICSGLWIPAWMLPSQLRVVSPILPPYHVYQLGRTALGLTDMSPVSAPQHIAMLVILTVSLILIAAFVWQRDRTRHA